VIFDCDGVLVDSEPIANRVFARMLADHGLAMTPEEVMARFVGRSRDSCIAMAGGMRGCPLPEGFAQEWDDALHEAMRREVKPVPGAPELLRSLQIPFCVASNGQPAHMQMSLAVTGLMPLVEGRIFSAAEVAHPKPAPDLFLHAARTMGAAPGECAVVEDTPTGVRAGIAAGMRVFAYTGGKYTDRAEVAALGGTVFDDMRQLKRLLEAA
jgi:HAD superfamily hydrolase (TIGR01509 family)